MTWIGPDGGGGGVAVPRLLISCAVVWRPIASTIVNVSGLTQLPFVMISNEPPEVNTVVLTIVTVSGNDGATWYGGVPP